MKAVTAATVLSGISLAAAAQFTDPAARLLGCYTHKERVLYLSGESLSQEKVQSVLNIAASVEGRISVNATMVGDNFHVCGISGVFELDQRAGEVEYWRLVPDEGQLNTEAKYGLPACRLRLVVSPRTLGFMDPEAGACHGYFGCGARIGISDVSFQRSTRKQAQPNACQHAS